MVVWDFSHQQYHVSMYQFVNNIDVLLYQCISLKTAGVLPSAPASFFFLRKFLGSSRTENVWPRADPGHVDWLGEAKSGFAHIFFSPMGCNIYVILGGGFKYFLFSPLPGEMIQCD